MRWGYFFGSHHTNMAFTVKRLREYYSAAKEDVVNVYILLLK